MIDLPEFIHCTSISGGGRQIYGKDGVMVDAQHEGGLCYRNLEGARNVTGPGGLVNML